MKYNSIKQRDQAKIPYLLFEVVVSIPPDYTSIQNYAASTEIYLFLKFFSSLFKLFCLIHIFFFIGNFN